MDVHTSMRAVARVHIALSTALVCCLVGAGGMAYVCLRAVAYGRSHPAGHELAGILAVGSWTATIAFLGLSWACYRLRTYL